ncbi:hypothetical protein QBC32DRAFT_80070 [Pseudoneurospora amorphoporcata]|uniref:Uncharacterized protein n=1 Tax=Pseudoneurospora amorphoporcata TaxID=241081 RepID=A0AAN6P2V5_9PEZI|nr:hypothetical protein QBC32DRAFT_80070 [Pseudoneurospora amorphoporcata]
MSRTDTSQPIAIYHLCKSLLYFLCFLFIRSFGFDILYRNLTYRIVYYMAVLNAIYHHTPLDGIRYMFYISRQLPSCLPMDGSLYYKPMLP